MPFHVRFDQQLHQDFEEKDINIWQKKEMICQVLQSFNAAKTS